MHMFKFDRDSSKENLRKRKNQGMLEVLKPEKSWQVSENGWSQQIEHMQVPNGTGPGVRRIKRPLSAWQAKHELNMTEIEYMYV